MILDHITIAVKNMRKRKLRSLLTLIGIFISIMTIFVLVSISLGLQDAVEEQFRQFGTDKIFIQPRGQIAGPGTGGAVMLTEDDVEVVEKVIGVKDLTWWTATTGEIEFKDEKRFFTIIGFPLDRDDVFLEGGFYNVDEGKFLEVGDIGKVTLGSQYRYNNVYKRPVRIRDKISVNGEEFRVKAIMKSVGNPPDDRLVFMSEEEFREITGIEDRVDTIIAQIEPGEDINEVADRIERRLFKSRDVDEKTRDFSILTPEAVLETFGVVLNIITAFLLGVAGISLLVGGIGIANTMYASVLERTREIGVMKAIGAKNSDILSIFVVESGLLGLIGGIIGVIFGFGVVKGIEFIAVNQLGTTLLRAATPFYLFAGCLAFAFLSGAISGALPAYRASKTSPVEALRHE